MRNLVITQNITLDGVIDAAGDWFGPANSEHAWDVSDLIKAQTAQREAAVAFLVGRTTFEQMRSYWPSQTDDKTGVTEYLNQVRKYVVSSRLEDSGGWEPTTILRGLDDIRALKAQPGADIVVTGSLTLVRDLVPSGLVDEYRLFVYPVVVGAGQRLFEPGTQLRKLETVETRRFASGLVLLRYRIA